MVMSDELSNELAENQIGETHDNLTNHADEEGQADSVKIEEEVQVQNLLVRITGEKPESEVVVGKREQRYLAIRSLVEDFGKSGLSYRGFIKSIQQVDVADKYGFPTEIKITRAKLWRWVKQPASWLDDRYFGKGRLTNINKVTAVCVVQIMRESPRIKPKAVTRRLTQLSEERPELGIIVPSKGTVTCFMRRMNKERIPELLTAARAGSLYKKFGIRIPHPWFYSNEAWQIDAAESRVSVWYRGEIIKPHIVNIVDCKSGLIVAAGVYPHEPHPEESAETLMKAILPKDHPFYNWGGLFKKLFYDQHGQFHTPKFWKYPQKLDIKTIPIPVRQSPHNGGVERSFGTMRRNFESDFPDFIKRRGRFVSEDTLRYAGDYDLFCKELENWVDYRNFEAKSADGLTPIVRWHQEQKQGMDIFPDNIRQIVGAAFVIHEQAKITDNCVVNSRKTGLCYTSGTLAGKQGLRIDLQISLMDKKGAVLASHRGTGLGMLSVVDGTSPKLNAQVNRSNLAFIQENYEAVNAADKMVGTPKQLSKRLNDIQAKHAPEHISDHTEITIQGPEVPSND